jgi:uncharacterized protein
VWWAVLLACLALLFALPAYAEPQFPALTGRVVDAANILSPEQEQEIDAKLAALETQSQRQLVVATLPDLQGYEISDYGYQLGRHWGLGDKQRNDGALLIVAPKERKVRIEVGYGLEGILTDALSSVIINQDIVPRFRAGDYPGGIAAGVDRLVAQLQLPEDQARRVAEQAQAQQVATPAAPHFSFSTVIFLLFILFFFVLPMLRGMRGGRRHGGGGLGSIILWSALNNMGRGGGGGFGGGGFGGGGFGGGGGGGFSGGGGSFGGGGASGGW